MNVNGDCFPVFYTEDNDHLIDCCIIKRFGLMFSVITTPFSSCLHFINCIEYILQRKLFDLLSINSLGIPNHKNKLF